VVSEVSGNFIRVGIQSDTQIRLFATNFVDEFSSSHVVA
jgi:hypothetical protein